MRLEDLKQKPVGFYKVYFLDGRVDFGCIGRFDDGFNTEASLWICFPNVLNGSVRITKAFAKKIEKIERKYLAESYSY